MSLPFDETNDMMNWLALPAAALLGYLLGAIPVGYLVCRLYGVDIKTVGSGRTGTTNAWRAAGAKAAIPTLIGDTIKGAVAVWLARQLYYLIFPDPTTMSVAEANQLVIIPQLAAALAGGFAIVGHNWSIFFGFKGGAGGIIAAATTLAISPLVGSIVCLIGAFMIWWSRISSVGTFAVGASAFTVFLVLGLEQLSPWPYIVYGVIAMVAIFIALRSNREKLRDGKERVNTLW